MSQLVTTCHSFYTLSNKILHYVTLFIVTYCEKCVTKRYFPWHIVTSQKCIKIKFKRFYLGVTVCHILSHLFTLCHCIFSLFRLSRLDTAKNFKMPLQNMTYCDNMWKIVTNPWQAVTSRDKPWDSCWGAVLYIIMAKKSERLHKKNFFDANFL